jgi:hypothetical protein
VAALKLHPHQKSSPQPSDTVTLKSTVAAKGASTDKDA